MMYKLSQAGRKANLEYWTELQRIQLMQAVKVNQEVKFNLSLSQAGSRANLEYWTELQRRQLMQGVKVNQEIKRCIPSLVREHHLASLGRERSVVFNAALCDND